MAVSADGEKIKTSKTVSSPQDFEEGIRTLEQAAQELAGQDKITAVAGGIAGPISKDKSMLVASPHLPNWVNRPLKQTLESHFRSPVFLENDAALVGLGEATNGAGVGKDIVAYLTVSTGVGGVRIAGQKIDKNSYGFEPGHQTVVINGNPCRCGGKGHLETYIGGWYLQKYYNVPAGEIKDSAVWDNVAKFLALGLSNTIVHWSPDIVVLGGSVVQSIPVDKVEAYLKEDLTIFPEAPELALGKLGNGGGLYGALAHLKNFNL